MDRCAEHNVLMPTAPGGTCESKSILPSFQKELIIKLLKVQRTFALDYRPVEVGVDIGSTHPAMTQ